MKLPAAVATTTRNSGCGSWVGCAPWRADASARHGAQPTHEPHPEFRVVVATAAGNFTPADGLREGAEVRDGQAVGAIATRQGPVEVTAHGAGTLAEWLAHDDDPVAPGQPLARLGGPL